MMAAPATGQRPEKRSNALPDRPPDRPPPGQQQGANSARFSRHILPLARRARL